MFKNIITSVIMLMGFNLYSQIDCNITLRYPPDTTKYHNDTTLCYNSGLVLYTQFDMALNYSWEPNSETGVIIEVDVTDTITYILHVYNEDSTFHCTDTVTLNIYPRVIIEFEQLVFGCPLNDTLWIDTICKAQVKANVTGGYPPYHYYWGDYSMVNPMDSSWAINLCVNQIYTLRASDAVCDYFGNYEVKAFSMPEIQIKSIPDTIHAGDEIIFSFENHSSDSIPLSNWYWTFSDTFTTTEENPVHTFGQEEDTGGVEFCYTTTDGCTGKIFYNFLIYEPIKNELDRLFIYPNPSDGYSTIRYYINKIGNVTIKVNDLFGMEIYTVTYENQVAGEHQVYFDGSQFSQGLYICRLFMGDLLATQKMLLVD
jgi:hypothetical protein